MSLALKVIPPVQLVICAVLMYALANYFPQYSFYLATRFPLIILFMALAVMLGSLALYDFHKHNTTFHPHTPEKTTTVVDSGIYAYSRNPMYLALVLVLLALALFLENIFCFFVLPLFVGYITYFQIKPEEEMLNKLFPHDYQTYCQKVRRWL